MKKVPISSVCTVSKGSSMIKKNAVEGDIPVIAGGKNPACFHNASNRPGNIITISASGANAGYVNYFPYPIFASDCVTVRSKDEGMLMTKFVYLYLRSIQEMIYNFQKGAGQPHVYSSDIARIEIPVPSIDEQKTMVRKLDRISELIILKKEAVKKTEALINPLFLEMFGEGPRPGYSKAALRDLVSEFRYGTSQKSGEVGLPVLRIPNIVNGIDLRDLKYCELGNSEQERLILKGGDILFVRTNGNPAFVGRNAVFDLEGKFAFASYLIRARLKNELIDPYYLLAYLRIPEGANQIRAAIKTSAGQYNINIEGLGGLVIPVPELSKQREFASILAKVERLLVQHNSALQNLQSLYDTTSQESFK